MRAPDQDLRDRIVAARNVNLAVEAGAGTGKTSLLVERVVDLVRTGTPLARLAIITFTRKAAAELESRLVRRLAEARGEGHPWAATALEDLPRASLGTTDSFCRSILADFALEAGVPPGFALAAEFAEDALRDAAWARFLARANDRESRLFERLRELGLKPSKLREVADGFLDHRDLPVAVDASDAPGDLVGVWAEALAPALAMRGRCTDPGDRLLRRVEELERALVLARDVGGGAAERLLLSLARAGRRLATRQGRKAAWGGDAPKAEVIAALEKLEEGVARWRRARGAARAAAVAAWLAGYAAEYRAVKRERGLVDFRDLALTVRDLLRDDRAARRRLASRWDAILVDEAQDTDPLQMEIAILLAAREPVPRDPFEAELEPGRLFLVGDPKQSIYRFRRADLELYARTRDAVVAGGEAPAIRANFRSHPALLDFVNATFAGWMEPPPNETFQAPYVELRAGRETRDDDGSARVTLILPDPALRARLIARSGGERLTVDDRAELETDAVVRTIRGGLGLDGRRSPWRILDPATGRERAARPGDVAVLVRRMTGGERLLDGLRRAGVPAASMGGRYFHEREEIQTLIALLEAIADPDNPAALFAALRSPALAVTDDDLVLHFADPAADPRAAGVSEGALEAERRLRALAEEARRSPLADLLERLAEELALFPAFGFRPDGAARVESLRLLLEAAAPLEDAGVDSVPELVHWLRGRSTDEPLALGEIEPSGQDAVSLLTIHKAKGLEFPIVLVADLGGRPASPSSIVADRTTSRLEFRLPGTDVATAGWDEASEREGRRRLAEEIRLLYVAFTRARDRLLLAWTEGQEGFLAPGFLPARLGTVAGQPPPPSSTLGVLEAATLPPWGDTARIHVFETKSALARLRSATGPRDLFAPPVDVAASTPPVLGRLLPVTALADSGVEPITPTWAQVSNELYGKEFGAFVHAVLEALDPSGGGADALERAIDTAFARAGSPVEDATRAQWRAEAVRMARDPAVAALLHPTAPDRPAWREVPFVLPIGDDFLAGTVDLLREEPDGSLVLVDWKTDRVPLGKAAVVAARHHPQLSLYVRAVARLTGRVVREARLVFLGADPVEIVRVPADESLELLARSILERPIPAGPIRDATEPVRAAG